MSEQNLNKITDLYKTKDKLLSREVDLSSLSSTEIKGLLEILDWSSEIEKKAIIDLCRAIIVRGDSSLITGD